jgi:hypothetical protein
MSKTKNIFCIVGESGSGKTYYGNSIILDNKFMKKAKLNPLIYGTTRTPRKDEKDGLDYNFISIEEYNNIPIEELIETRTYNTIDGSKHYFTKRDYIEKSKSLDADISSELLISIFFPRNPLHDGGVIIQGNKITSAGAVFPISLNGKINKKLGTRHRAAIGISEESDAIAIIVSEETGRISIAINGDLNYNL